MPIKRNEFTITEALKEMIDWNGVEFDVFQDFDFEADEGLDNTFILTWPDRTRMRITVLQLSE